MSQPTSSLADVPMSASSRDQFHQYLARLPSASSSYTLQPSELPVLLQRSGALASRVEALHAQISSDTLASRVDDPQLFWSTVTLLTHLREVSSLLQRAVSSSSAQERKACEVASTRAKQDVELTDSMLRLLSVSGSETSRDAFTAPVKTQPIAGTASVISTRGGRKGYEYWKQRTLAAIDTDDLDTQSISSGDEDAATDTESILTDPDIHLASSTKTSHTPLAGLKPNGDDDDISQYERSLKPITPATTSTHTPPTSAPASASDTILQSDRANHEALSSELLRMASILKSNSLAFADSLERDRLLLEKAGTDLGQNLDLMTRTRGRLGVYSKKARSMGWFTLSAILVVIVSWMMMFLLIRLT